MQRKQTNSAPFGISSILIIAVLVFHVMPASAQQADAESYYKYGTQLIRQQKYQDALKYIEYALAQNPSIPGAWTQVGYCYEFLGQKDKAIEGYQKAVAANPEDAYAKSRLTALGAAPPVVPITDTSELPVNTQEERDQMTSLAVSSRTREPKYKKFSFSLQAGPSVPLGLEIVIAQTFLPDPFLEPLLIEETSGPIEQTIGMGFDFGFDYSLNSRISLGLTVGISKTSNLTGWNTRYEYTDTLTTLVQESNYLYKNLSVTSVTPQITYFKSASSLSFYGGLGISINMVNLEREISEAATLSGLSVGTDIDEWIIKGTGSAIGLMIRTGAELKISKAFGIFLEAGVRVGSSKLSGTEVYTHVETGDFGSVSTSESTEMVWAEAQWPDGTKVEGFVDKEFVGLSPDVNESGVSINSLKLGLGLRIGF